MLARNILLLLISVCAASSKHIHSYLHKNHVEQIPIFYIAAVAAGFPLSSSSDRSHLTSAARGILNQMPANAASGQHNSWTAGYEDTNQWLQVSFITPREVISVST